MVEVYYHDNKDTVDNFTEPHDSGRPVSLEDLSKIGVFYKHITTKEELDALANERHYKNRDEVNLNLAAFNNDMNAYNAKMQQFYKEHYHEDEEIRYIVEGEGYFDVRNTGDEWIRAKLVPNDLLILPAGIYHRFTLTDALKSVRAVRLFKDQPKWEAINRDSGRESEARLSYAKTVAV
ncbi:ADI1 [Candida oxycetoniae]|uniref:Acireductone dioxygenase n=1 Tax=Candida oxycetoniae TaxID=497107 RepID=A0AAI9SZ79_9ASCO|nr:ADI1 [Candida oxycetoniae]KAI3405399.2 ADI1 [Candida oxycetoniae]